MDVNIRERQLPHIGRQYELVLADGHTLVVTLETRSEERIFSAIDPGRDSATLEVRLSEPEAVAVAALLSGANVVIESEPAAEPVTGVHVETVTLSAASPAIGRLVDEIERPDPEAAMVLAVIRDDTPALVEDDASRPCQPGDRLVIAGRPEALRELRTHLIG